MTAPKAAQTADIRRIRRPSVGCVAGDLEKVVVGVGNVDALISLLAPGKLLLSDA
jgi:hypothetical protein